MQDTIEEIMKAYNQATKKRLTDITDIIFHWHLSENPKILPSDLYISLGNNPKEVMIYRVILDHIPNDMEIDHVVTLCRANLFLLQN